MFKVSDSVVVKPATADPDFGINIGGWQGRISGMDAGKGGQTFISIQWDSITLKNMPGSVIEQCEERGLAWTEIVLAAKEVELTTPRDTEEDVAKIIAELSTEYAELLGRARQAHPAGIGQRGSRP